MNKALEKDKAHMGKRYIEGNFANFTLLLKKLGHTIQGRNLVQNLGEAKPMVGHNLPP